MSGEDAELFLHVYKTLHLAVSSGKLDDARVLVFFERLSDLDYRDVKRAADEMAEKFDRFPTVAQWRKAVRKVVDAERKPQALTEQAGLYCRTCEDSGWVLGLTCDGGSTCGRDRPHAEHRFTRPCACRRANRNYQDSLLRTVKHAKEEPWHTRGGQHE